MLGVALYWGLTAQVSGLPSEMVGESNDLKLYRDTGESLLIGEIPYQDFFIEYPPGAIPAFLLPALLSSTSEGFGSFFVAEMTLLLVATMMLVAVTARRVRGEWAWVVPSLTFAIGTVLLYPVATTRFDPVVSFTLALAAFCAVLGGRFLLLAYASLGLGAAAKLIPALATVPLALVRSGYESFAGWLRRTVVGFLAFSATLGLFFVPAYLLGGEMFEESFTYHADRGLQLESLATVVLMKLGWVENIVFQYGAWEIEGRGVELLSALSLPISGVLILITGAAMYRDQRLQGFVAAKFPRYAAAFILAFMIGSKVLSPQYMLWLLPLVPLATGGIWGIVIAGTLLVTCWTTTQVYPYYYGELRELEPSAINLLLVRDLFLVLLWGLMLILPNQEKPEKNPA